MNKDITKEQAERLSGMSSDKFIEWVSGYSFPADILTVAKDAWQAALTQQAGVNAEGWSTEVTKEMKAACIGEFHIDVDESCSACALHEPDDECEVCGGEVSYTRSVTVPWDVCKAIYRAMLAVVMDKK